MRKQYNRVFAFTLVATMVFATMTGCSKKAEEKDTVANKETAKFLNGTYTSDVTGMHDMKVTVTIDADQIQSIEVEHTETPGVGEPAVDVMKEKVLSSQSTEVDGVSGATLTSNAILAGVQDCMAQAGTTQK